MSNDTGTVVRPEPNLVKALAALYPEARDGRDYVVRDDSDGRGAYIALWNPVLGQVPAPEAIAAAWYKLLDDEEANAYQRARADALAKAVPLDTLLAALVEATPAEPGTPLARVKAIWAGICKDHPAPTP